MLSSSFVGRIDPALLSIVVWQSAFERKPLTSNYKPQIDRSFVVRNLRPWSHNENFTLKN